MTQDVSRTLKAEDSLAEFAADESKLDERIRFNKGRYPPWEYTSFRAARFMENLPKVLTYTGNAPKHSACLLLKLAFTDDYLKKVGPKINEGEMNIFQHANHLSRSREPYDLKNNISLYLHGFMYAYLKCLMENNKDLDEDDPQLVHNPVLFRNLETSEVETFQGIQDEERLKYLLGGMLFDPMGGLFVANKLLKRQHLKIRSTLMRSLWDMSLKLKMNLIKELSKKS